MIRKRIAMPKKVKQEIDKYPMVSVEWFDIVSDSSWSSFSDVKKAKLATCITKGHLLSQAKGVTRIFGVPGEENADFMISLKKSKKIK